MGAMWTPLADAFYRLSLTVPTSVKERIERCKRLTRVDDVARVVCNALELYEMIVQRCDDRGDIRGAHIRVTILQPGKVDSSTITIGFNS